MSIHASRPWQACLPFFYGWIIVSLGFVSAFFGIGLTWAAGLFAVPMHAELGWSRSAIFFAISLRGWMGIVITPLIGSYIDRRSGPRVLCVAGGMLNTITLLLLTFVHAQWQFALLFGVLGGVAQAAQSNISVAVVPKWFIRRRGSAVSISTLGGGLAAFVMPPLVNWLTGITGSWRASWACLGILALLLSTIPSLLLQRQPEDLGLLPDGDPALQRTGRPLQQQRRETPSLTLREALHTSTFWMLMLGISIGSLSNNGIPANMASIFVDRGLSLRTAGAALMWYGFASVASKLVWGWVANRFHLRTVLMVLTLYGLFALPAIVFIPAAIGRLSLGYGFLVGLFVGAFVPLSQLVWAEYFGRAHVGAISAAGRPLGIILISSGPFLLAFLRDLTGSYSLGILVNTAAVAICLACLYLVRPLRSGSAAEGKEATPMQPAS